MSSLSETAVARLAQGYRAFLGKPFLGPELLRTIERVLEGQGA
jgi:DNA-binding NtrC family response regulator